MDLKSSESARNLMRAFAGESQARNRYTIAAAQAKAEGHYALEAIFNYTAGQEKEHAEIFYKHLAPCAGDSITIDGGYPIDIAPTTAGLLRMAQHNEYEEYGDAYPAFAEVAKKEDFSAIAASFELISKIEKTHGDRFGRFAEFLESGKLYVSDVKASWICLNCGHIYSGLTVPPKCPVCEHDRGYFIRIELSPFEGSLA